MLGLPLWDWCVCESVSKTVWNSHWVCFHSSFVQNRCRADCLKGPCFTPCETTSARPVPFPTLCGEHDGAQLACAAACAVAYLRCRARSLLLHMDRQRERASHMDCRPTAAPAAVIAFASSSAATTATHCEVTYESTTTECCAATKAALGRPPSQGIRAW